MFALQNYYESKIIMNQVILIIMNDEINNFFLFLNSSIASYIFDICK